MARKRKSFLRTGHGAGKGTPHIEVVGDEVSAPVPAAEPTSQLRRRQNGQISDSETARELGRRGGLATARRVRLIDSLGLAAIAENSDFAPYRTGADAFVEHHLAELAKLAGGKVGSAPSTMVSSAALQLAASRFCFDRGAQSGDVQMLKLGSSLANDSRQNLLAAYELAVREAEARGQNPDDDPFFVPADGKERAR
jgi:hypothetical protein